MTAPGPAANIARLSLGLALVSSLTLLGCATKSIERVAAPARPLRTATLEEVLSAYDGHCRKLETLSASGDLDVKDLRAGKERKLGVRVLATRGGRLYIKGTVLLVTALEVVSNGERFWFQVPSKKTVWTGASGVAVGAEGADQAPYYALRPEDVTAALLPEPLAPGAHDALALEADREAFCLTLAKLGEDGRGVVRRRVCVDRESLLPVHLRAYDERGELVSEASLSGYSGAQAHDVVISRPAEGYVAEFTLDKLETNQAVPERAFSPRTPATYRVVEVGAP